jgi:hypothetical protein
MTPWLQHSTSNGRLDKQISTWGFARWRSFDNISEYHHLFPSSRLFLLYKLGLTVVIAGLISIGLCFEMSSDIAVSICPQNLHCIALENGDQISTL